MIFFLSRTVRGASISACALFFTILCSLLVLSASNASAGHNPENSRTHEGGGTWGAILELSVEVNGPSVRFMIQKKDGLPFNIENEITIRTGSWRGESIKSGMIRPGSRTSELTVNLDRVMQEQTYYACLSNSYGYAWVGPVRITTGGAYHKYAPPVEAPGKEYDEPYEGYHTGYTEDTYEDMPAGPAEEGLSRPLISKYPYKTPVNTQVHIAVTTGTCRQDGLVRVQCVASGSEYSPATPYNSGWVRTGAQVTVPFRFHTVGSQTISCRTVDSCCFGPWAGRSIDIMQNNRPPLPPGLSPAPARAEAGIPVYIPVRAGADPDGDQVRVMCRADDAARIYSSGWLNYPQVVDAMFVFERFGDKEIACITVDRKGAKSEPARRTILAGKTSVHSKSASVSRTQTKINISVVTGADGTADSKVQVESSKTESCAPFCDDGEITYDKPYLPEYRPASEPEAIYPGASQQYYDGYPQP